MLKTVEIVRMYSVPFKDERISQLISWYVETLQKGIDIIWESIEWRYDFKNYRKGRCLKVKVPVLPKNSQFKRELRDRLMKDNPYARHWVDAVIRTAYSIVKSWRKRYVKGRAKKRKPRVKRRFARCKVTLMKVDYERKVIRITLRPYEYVEVPYGDGWFVKQGRVDGCTVGEVILKDDRVLIPFKKFETVSISGAIGWDCNELTIDGFSPSIGFIHVDLKPLISTRIKEEKKLRKIRSIASKRLKSGKRMVSEYSRRWRNRCRDLERKLAVQLSNLFPSMVFGFEKLNKESMFKNKSKKFRKRIARVSWRNIVKELKQRVIVREVNPRDTSKTCSRCRFKVKDLKGRVFRCPRCGLVLDRQKNACVNIYLKMMGFPHSKDWWNEVVKPLIHHELWVGVALIGRTPRTWSPMKGDLKAMKPKRLVDPSTSIKVYQP